MDGRIHGQFNGRPEFQVCVLQTIVPFLGPLPCLCLALVLSPMAGQGYRWRLDAFGHVKFWRFWSRWLAQAFTRLAQASRRMDVQTNRCADFPCVLEDFVPFGAAAQNDGKGYFACCSFVMYPSGTSTRERAPLYWRVLKRELTKDQPRDTLSLHRKPISRKYCHSCNSGLQMRQPSFILFRNTTSKRFGITKTSSFRKKSIGVFCTHRRSHHK